MPKSPPRRHNRGATAPASPPEPPAASAAATTLGQRLRSMRYAKGWTLERASLAMDLSRSAISKIERGDVTPSFDALLKLAAGFGLEISDLLAGAAAPPQHPPAAAGRRSITRTDGGLRHDMQHYRVRMLAQEIRNPAFVPYEFTATCLSLDDFQGWDRHDSEDFIYVLSGTMELHTELYEPVRLRIGESIYFDARVGHRILAVGRRPARGLCVSAPFGRPVMA